MVSRSLCPSTLSLSRSLTSSFLNLTLTFLGYFPEEDMARLYPTPNYNTRCCTAEDGCLALGQQQKTRRNLRQSYCTPGRGRERGKKSPGSAAGGGKSNTGQYIPPTCNIEDTPHDSEHIHPWSQHQPPSPRNHRQNANEDGVAHSNFKVRVQPPYRLRPRRAHRRFRNKGSK